MWHRQTFTAIITVCMAPWTTLKALPPAERWHRVMFWLFWVYIVVFAVGYTVREALPAFCGAALILYYIYNWRESTLRRCAVWWLFLFFAAATVWGVIMSQNVWGSFLHVIRGCNKAYVLVFVAMECVRDAKDLRRLVWAIVLACLWQGGDGIWQHITGFDFIDHYPPVSGRLTGSFNDYRVGNYVALMLIPAAGVYWLLRAHAGRIVAALGTLALLGPAAYLLYFSYTRNGYLAVIAAISFWMLIKGSVRWKPLIFAGGALLAVALLVPHRLGADAISRDGRWDLWRFAWDVFCEFPITGAGFWEYNTAFRALGHVPTLDPLTISHPHNIYLQLLCESGVVGFGLMMVFLLGMLIWGYRRIAAPLRAELARARAGNTRCDDMWWRIAALFWCGWGAFLVSGIFGHDFYRIWWQALVLAHLGIMLGAIVRAEQAQANAPPHDHA